MIKSIVVAVDNTEASRAAEALALRIAVEHQAAVTGMGIVDRPWITAPTPMPIGGGAYKQHRDEVLLEKNREAVRQLLKSFRERCSAADVRTREIDAEGVPHEVIEQEACRHDLIVIGRDTDFHDSEHPSIAETVTRLLRNNPRPVLVVPGHQPPGDRLVVAFDGGIQASRAMHLFVLLGLATDREVHIVNVADSASKARANAERALGLFETHGIRAQVHGIEASAHPADVLIGNLAGLGAGMLVMGAFSQHGLLHRVFVGSVTRRLLEAGPVPLFVYN